MIRVKTFNAFDWTKHSFGVVVDNRVILVKHIERKSPVHRDDCRFITEDELNEFFAKFPDHVNKNYVSSSPYKRFNNFTMIVHSAEETPYYLEEWYQKYPEMYEAYSGIIELAKMELLLLPWP